MAERKKMKLTNVWAIILAIVFLISLPSCMFEETSYKSEDTFEFVPIPDFTIPEIPELVLPELKEPSPPVSYGYYIGNRVTKIYHLPSCSYLPTVNNFTISRVKLYKYKDFSPCKHCNP